MVKTTFPCFFAQKRKTVLFILRMELALGLLPASGALEIPASENPN